jgi:hypothetical protein
MGRGSRKGGTEDKAMDRIDRGRGRDTDSGREFWAYLKMVEEWAARHGFNYTEAEVNKAWSSGQEPEEFILGKCRRK